MSEHRLRLPKPGGDWQPDPHRSGLSHRGGNPWDRVRPPRRHHRCLAQSRLVWTIDTVRGNHVAAVLWCACGSVSYSGTDGRWVGKNIRHTYRGGTLPIWHRAMPDLRSGPAIVFARPRAQTHGEATERSRQDRPASSVEPSVTSRTAVEAPLPPSMPPAVPPVRCGESAGAVDNRAAPAGSRRERRSAA